MKSSTSLREIQRSAMAIAAAFRPEKIILFGSRARGTARRESDVYLLVIARTTQPVGLAGRILDSLGGQFAADVLVRTPREMKRVIADGDSFVASILSEGTILYEARRRGVGTKGGGRLPRRAS